MEVVTVDRLASDLRGVYPRVLGKTLALTGRLVDAEDAVQDAVERALATWPRTGPPESPEAWLVAVAANCHRSRLRRDRRQQRHANALATLAQMSPWVQSAIGVPEVARGWKDDLLRLLFACCHPSLDTGESAALALATVLGLSSAEIAQGFALAPRSMDQRLTRARRRLREQGDCEAPDVEAAAVRLDAVLSAVHLLFNEGYWSTHDEAPIRADLCRLALGLGRSLREAFPAEPEVLGLLALLILHEGRRPARLDADGLPVALPDQDRRRWDPSAIAEGVALVEAALRLGNPGPLQVEAAIAALHCRAEHAADTDWPQVAELYAHLERMRPTPAVRVNRAFAVARVEGAAAGLALLDEFGAGAASYPYVHLVRGALLEEVGKGDAAITELELAVALARNAHEKRQINDRITRLREGRST